jgi:hypothetical protein
VAKIDVSEAGVEIMEWAWERVHGVCADCGEEHGTRAGRREEVVDHGVGEIRSILGEENG